MRCPISAATFAGEQARGYIAPFYAMPNQPATNHLKALSAQVLGPEWGCTLVKPPVNAEMSSWLKWVVWVS